MAITNADLYQKIFPEEFEDETDVSEPVDPSEFGSLDDYLARIEARESRSISAEEILGQ